jgi:hypothetical protein
MAGFFYRLVRRHSMGRTPMNIDGMRSALAEFRSAADERATALKDSQLALDELLQLYERLDDSERALANDVIAEWVASDDEKLRFDALALIDRYVIGGAVESLQGLAERLRVMRTPGAPYELQKVDRILRRLRS